MVLIAKVSAGSREFVSSPPEGDGERIGRVVLPATDQPPFGSQKFCVPCDACGQSQRWVRIAAWDSAGNGAFTQPVHLM
jgi:hypothetical protein